MSNECLDALIRRIIAQEVNAVLDNVKVDIQKALRDVEGGTGWLDVRLESVEQPILHIIEEAKLKNHD